MLTQEKIEVLEFYEYLNIKSESLEYICKKVGKEIVLSDDIFKIKSFIVSKIIINYPLLYFHKKYPNFSISAEFKSEISKNYLRWITPKYHIKNNINIDIGSYSLDGNLEMIKYLHRNGQVLDIKCVMLIKYIIRKGHVDVLEYYLINGLEENLLLNCSPYIEACEHGQLEMLKFLRTNLPFIVNYQHLMGVAIDRDHINIVKYIHESCYVHNSGVLLACCSGNIVIFDYLYEPLDSYLKIEMFGAAIDNHKLDMVMHLYEIFQEEIKNIVWVYDFYVKVVLTEIEIVKYLIDVKIITLCEDLCRAIKCFETFDECVVVIEYLKKHFDFNENTINLFSKS